MSIRKFCSYFFANLTIFRDILRNFAQSLAEIRTWWRSSTSSWEQKTIRIDDNGLNNFIDDKHYELIASIPGNIYQLKIVRLCAPSLSANLRKYGRPNSTQWGGWWW